MKVKIIHMGTRRDVEGPRGIDEKLERMNSYFVYIYMLIAANGMIDIREVPSYEEGLVPNGEYEMDDKEWEL